jgi:hypothetical protein
MDNPVERLILNKTSFVDYAKDIDYHGKIQGSYLFLIPAYVSIQPLFAISFAALINKMNDLGIKYSINFEVNTYLPIARERLSKSVEFTMNDQYDMLIWLDSDVQFDPYQVLYLMYASEKEGCITSPVIYSRMEPHAPLVYDLVDDKMYPIASLPSDTEWIWASAVGFGCVVMPKQTLLNLERPHFLAGLNDTRRFEGEDIFFFRKLIDASQEVKVCVFNVFGHIGGVVRDAR